MNEDKIIHEVWMPCTRKLTLPEYIEGSARGKIKREDGRLIELKLLNQVEWYNWLNDLLSQRTKATEDAMKKDITENLYGDKK